MLHHQSSQHSNEQGRVRGGIDVAANLAEPHPFLDQLLHRSPEFLVRFGHLAPNLAQRTKRLADQHVHRVSIARSSRTQIRFCRDEQRFHSVPSRQRGFHHFCKVVLQAFGHRAYQRTLRSEAMADQSVAVTGQVADFHQRRPAAALPFDQFERRVEHPLIGELASLRLCAAAAWRAL